jgi:hypothetical protein
VACNNGTRHEYKKNPAADDPAAGFFYALLFLP